MKNEKYADLRPCAVGEGHAPPGDALAARTNRRQNGKRPPICHCEEATGRRGALSAKREEVPLGCNLAVPSRITGYSRRIRQPYATGRRGRRPLQGACGRRESPEICNCRRRSLSAATDAIGWYVFIGTLYELEVPSRDCHVASLLAMTIRGLLSF